jgi:hypothetical protein
MNCTNCGKKVEKDWNFCPKCGIHIAKASFFDKILSKAVSQIGPFKEFEKNFDNMEKTDSRMRKNMFSISISFGNDKQPKVRIQPMGKYSGRDSMVERTVQEKPITFSRKASGDIEEPKTQLRKVGGKFTANILLPDIDSEKDIEIKKIGESIEIRAYTKDKTYFKILKCPQHAEILNQNFQDGKLLLEFA